MSQPDLKRPQLETALAACMTSFSRDETGHRLHRYMAEIALPLGIEAAQMRGEDSREIENLQNMHSKAAVGEGILFEHWLKATEKTFVVLFRLAFIAEKTYRVSHASALEFAAGNQEMIEKEFGSSKAYADYYGTLNSEANTQAFARANAQVHSKIAARLFASESPEGLDEVALLSLLKAFAYAFAAAHAFGELEARYCQGLQQLTCTSGI
ncbi:hypothetical protein [Pseudovibrio brasiliensis]|uniref:Uncharacterized protein n=1 Tax=Pseudovibrio brasiliensis TaxID=1898042 RepID=A0ABX8AV61_9HYPH|nr:hypothetical protein [Pseudovibrio brasiliensis]QUS58943.1 hypothetical protein KGB56_24790 [Pseudovibrio brasiliensis]